MVWKTKHRKRYYYRSCQHNGKTIHPYVGNGVVGRLAAECDELARVSRRRRRTVKLDWLQRFETRQIHLLQIGQQLDTFLRAHLLAAGYYRYNRCTWRQRKMNAPASQSNLKNLSLAELNDLANAGDANAVARLRAILEANPQLARQLGDVAAHAKEALLQRVIKTDATVGEAVRLMLDELKRNLLPAKPTAIQQLAADRVVLIYAEIYLLDAIYPLVSELEPQQARVVAKAKDSAQRRYGLSLKTLAAVNKLAPLPRRMKPGKQSELSPLKVFD